MSTTLTPNETFGIASLVKEHSGIVIDESKTYLFEMRLRPLMRECGIDDLRAFTRKVKTDHRLCSRVVDAMCTNETSFMRDRKPFDLLIQKIVPDFYEKTPGGTFNFWSAAASTGQELYSVIMKLNDAGILGSGFNLRLLGTDISDYAISRASSGTYSSFEISRGLDERRTEKYFDQVHEKFKIKDPYRALVKFKRFNLLQFEKYPELGRFDAVFCRNVAIYFSQEDRTLLFEGIAELLSPGGVLVIGGQESLIGVTDKFVRQDFRDIIYYIKRP